MDGVLVKEKGICTLGVGVPPASACHRHFHVLPSIVNRHIIDRVPILSMGGVQARPQF